MNQIIRKGILRVLVVLFLVLRNSLTDNNFILEYISDFSFPAVGALGVSVFGVMFFIKIRGRWACLIAGYSALLYEMWHLFVWMEGTTIEIVAVASGTLYAYVLMGNGILEIE